MNKLSRMGLAALVAAAALVSTSIGSEANSVQADPSVKLELNTLAPTITVTTPTLSVAAPELLAIAPELPEALPAVLSDRTDCAQIRLDPDYRSENERVWFLTNCVTRVDATFALQQRPLVAVAMPVWATAPVVQTTAPVQTASAPAPVQKSATSVAPVQSYPAPDYCYAQFPSFAVGVQTSITGCNVVGDIQLKEGNTFVRKYDALASTGLFTDCMHIVCTFIPDFATNATSRTIEDMNSHEGCGIGCKLTSTQQVPFEASCKQDGVKLMPRERMQINPGCSVMGDIEVNIAFGGEFTKLYDETYQGSDHGVLFTCVTTCWVQAPFGATISAAPADRLAAEMSATGCAHGCSYVKRVRF